MAAEVVVTINFIEYSVIMTSFAFLDLSFWDSFRLNICNPFLIKNYFKWIQ